MATPTFVFANTYSNNGSTTSHPVVVPSGANGAAAGHTGILIASVTPGLINGGVPSGWVEVPYANPTVATSSSGRIYVWIKQSLVSGDLGSTITLTTDVASRGTAAVIVVTGARFLNVSSLTTVNGSATTSAAPSVTPPSAVSDALALFIHGALSNISGEVITWTPDALTTERVDISSTSGGTRNTTFLAATQALASNAATGTRTATSSGNVQRIGISLLFGDSTVTQVYQNLTTVGNIASGQATGSPTVSIASAIAPSSIASTYGVGTPVVNQGATTIAPAGIESGFFFGFTEVSSIYTVQPSSIASGEAFGSITVSVGPVTITPTSISSGEVFGNSIVYGEGTSFISPTGIATGEVFGVPDVAGVAPTMLTMFGIASGEVVPMPTLSSSGSNTTAPCSWNVIIPTCSQDDWDSYSLSLRDQAIDFATTVLWAATGRRFGLCTRTVWPCGRYEDGYSYGPGYYGPHGRWFPFNYYLHDWRGCYMCGLNSCNCQPKCQVIPLGPVAQVIEVVQDGEVVSPSAYRLDSNRYLVRTDGECWPRHVDRSTNVDEFKITYLHGEAVPTAVQLAAGTLAVEWAKACSGKPCRLPGNVSSVARQGVNITMVDYDLVLSHGFTGIQEVDRIIAVYNPGGLRQRSRVYDIDNPDDRWVL